jgi:hypothetical protein
MLVGYCHYRGGLVLMDSTVRHGPPVSFPRLTGDEARRAYGDLLTVDEASAPPAEPVHLLRRFLAAMQAGDEAAAGALAGSYNRIILEGPVGIARWRAFLGSRGPFAFLHWTKAPEPVFFRAKQSREEEKQHTADWFACFCKTRDCAGIWPIAAKDAAADADSDYACVRLFRAQTEGKSWEIGIDTLRARSFAVPD